MFFIYIRIINHFIYGNVVCTKSLTFSNKLNNHHSKNHVLIQGHNVCLRFPSSDPSSRLPIRIFLAKSIGVRHESRSSRILHLCNCPSWFRAHRRRRGIFHLFPFYLVYHPSWDPSWRLPIRLYYLCYLCYLCYFCCLCYLRYFCCCGRDHCYLCHFCCLCYLHYFCCCGRDHVCLVCYLS